MEKELETLQRERDQEVRKESSNLEVSLFDEQMAIINDRKRFDDNLAPKRKNEDRHVQNQLLRFFFEETKMDLPGMALQPFGYTKPNSVLTPAVHDQAEHSNPQSSISDSLAESHTSSETQRASTPTSVSTLASLTPKSPRVKIEPVDSILEANPCQAYTEGPLKLQLPPKPSFSLPENTYTSQKRVRGFEEVEKDMSSHPRKRTIRESSGTPVTQKTKQPLPLTELKSNGHTSQSVATVSKVQDPAVPRIKKLIPLTFYSAREGLLWRFEAFKPRLYMRLNTEAKLFEVAYDISPNDSVLVIHSKSKYLIWCSTTYPHILLPTTKQGPEIKIAFENMEDTVGFIDWFKSTLGDTMLVKFDTKLLHSVSLD